MIILDFVLLSINDFNIFPPKIAPQPKLWTFSLVYFKISKIYFQTFLRGDK